MKRILYISLVLIIGHSAMAQQQFVFTNYMLNQYYYNPAFAGSEDVHTANMGYRNQWAGFEGSPTTLYANFYGSVKNQSKHGYGVSIISDRSGLVQNTNFAANYVYHLKVSDSYKLAFGVRPGFQQFNIKLYDAQLADQGDDILTGNVLSTNAFDLNAGLYFYSDKLFTAISMRNTFTDIITFTGYNGSLARHYTFLAGYNFSKEKKKLAFQPSAMVNFVQPVDPQVSVMLKATYNNKFWVGLTCRTQDALGIATGIVIKNRFRIGYAFDYSLGDVRAYNYGSHEIMISFVTTSKKPSLDEQDEELNNSIFDDNKKKKEE